MNHDESSIDDPVDRLFALAKAGAEQGPYGHPLMTPTFTIDEMDVRQLFAGANDHLIRFYEQVNAFAIAAVEAL